MEAGAPAPHDAEPRLVRLAATLVGTGGLLFALPYLPVVGEQAGSFVGWWTPAAFVALVGGLVVLAVLGISWASTGTLRAAAGVVAAVVLVVLAGTPFAQVDPDLPGDRAPWVQGFVGAGAAAGALAWPVLPATAAAVVGAALFAGARWDSMDRSNGLLALQDGAITLILSLILVVTVSVVVRSGRALDRVSATATAAAAHAARVRARADERERLAGFVHDSVLSTLGAANRGGPVVLEAVRTEARRALDDLDELRQLDVEGGTGEMTGEHLRARIAVQAATAGQGALFTAEVEPDTVLPETVVTKVVGATTEALRNSARHAGAGARRWVTLTADTDRVLVVVSDDGTGFDPSDVPLSRYGLRGSILDRMERLPGGDAAVESQPGGGTRVRIGWRR